MLQGSVGAGQASGGPADPPWCTSDAGPALTPPRDGRAASVCGRVPLTRSPRLHGDHSEPQAWMRVP